MTSHDVVAAVRRGIQFKKIGHAGTLDPMATGVLVLCLGHATRLSEYVMESRKHYRARVYLGVNTDTYDAEGEIISQRDASHITEVDVLGALSAFTGPILQVPPMYSAIKQGGRKLYELARAGEVVERAPRPVTIDSLTLSEWESPAFTLDVQCSAGTYIRSLAFDLGESLGVGAHLAGLTRVASGAFTLDNAVTLEAFLAMPDWRHVLISPESALAQWHTVHLDSGQADAVLHGRRFTANAPDGILARALDSSGTLVAVLEAIEGIWHPRKVFPPDEI